MRVLITGGYGFIGSHLVDALVEKGHDVVVIDALSPAAHASVPAWTNAAAEYHEVDVTDFEALLPLVREVDAVSHQAARVGLGVDFDDVVAYTCDNDLGTATLLRALHHAGFAGRLVLASSMVVYGEGRYACPTHGLIAPAPRTVEALERRRYEPACPQCGASLVPGAVPETAPADPRNVYAATKLHQEHLCRAFGREHGVAVTALRYHNVYGPRMPRDTPYAGVASLFRSALARGDAPLVFEDGGQLRDFVHVRDVANANVCALTVADAYDGALNVASGTPRTIRQMAAALCDAFGPDAPRPEVVHRYRLGDVRHVFASPDRAATRIGFRAEIAFSAGMLEFAHAPQRDAVRV